MAITVRTVRLAINHALSFDMSSLPECYIHISVGFMLKHQTGIETSRGATSGRNRRGFQAEREAGKEELSSGSACGRVVRAALKLHVTMQEGDSKEEFT